MSSPVFAVSHLTIVGEAAMMPDPRVHQTWFGHLHSLRINWSKWSSSAENMLLEALCYMHNLEVFDASSEFLGFWVDDPYTERESSVCQYLRDFR